MNSLIWSEEELTKFYNEIFQPLELNEVQFISLSARNKYLSEEQKQEIRLGGTQMLFKTVLREYNLRKFMAKVHQIDESSKYYYSLNDKEIPRECLCYYANINPSDTLKATKEFKQLLDEYDEETVRVAMSEKRDVTKFENIMRRYTNLHNNLLTCYQNSRSRRVWVDFDLDFIDIDKKDMASDIIFLMNIFVNRWDSVHIIDTRGGIHFLCKVSDFNKEFNTNTILKALTDELGSLCKEIVLNKNEMIPIPGTYQGGYPVTMV